MNPKTPSQVLDELARQSLPADLDLTPQIMTKVQSKKGVAMQPRLKMLVTTLVVVLGLAAGLVNVPAVRAALQQWLGYLPGFGLVQTDQLRQLAEPVSLTQGEFTLTVEQALLNNEKIVINYRIEGLDDQFLDENHLCPGPENAPLLRDPAGRALELRGSGTSHGGGVYTGEVTYLPLAEPLEAATLTINCVTYAAPEQVPQQWEVALRFVEVPPAALTVVPVLEAPATLEPTAALPSGLTLATLIPTADGYIFTGTIQVIPPAGYTVDLNGAYLEDVTFTDANGQVLQFGLPPEDVLNTALQAVLPENTYSWACQVYGEQIQWPLTMTVNSVPAYGPPLPQAEFQIDVGAEPQPDQRWQLDREVQLGSKTIRIVSLQYVQNFHGMSGYLFETLDDNTLAFSLDLQGYQDQRRGGGGSGAPDENGLMLRLLGYAEPVPAGLLTVLVNGQEIIALPGPWQVTWQAPAP